MRHRLGAFALVLTLGILVATTSGGLGQPARLSPGPAVTAVAAVGMTVSNLERAVAFYAAVLGFERVAEVEVTGPEHERLQGLFGLRMRVARMRLGDERIELVEYLTPRGRPAPTDSRSHDGWFQHIAIIVSDMDRAYTRLRAHGVTHISSAPETLPDWNPSAGGIRAFYFRDPDGHPLELLQFPPDKGDAKWRSPGDRLFLGIDHTAIVVRDTTRSVRCYRDGLGFRTVGESENFGPEQERLSGVFGARVRITSLRAPAGPGVEFLEYVTPTDGRAVPADTRPNDLVDTRTVLVTADAERAAALLRADPCAVASPAVVTVEERTLGFRKSFLARDPDGHAVQVIEP
ncbi:MAG: VOC family protein [Candidatus Rokuibacteriota bacterium]